MPTFHDMPYVCSSSDIESSNHLFFSCHFSYNVPGAGVIHNWTDIQVVNHNEHVQHLLFAQNKIIFQGVVHCNLIISQIKMVSQGWFVSRAGRKSNLLCSDWFNYHLRCLSRCWFELLDKLKYALSSVL
jgi:hypothetical protein